MSKTTLYMALSVDGFIAGLHDETPWSDEEWAAFREFVRSCDVCLLGRRTYEIMRDADEFVERVKYIVATQDKDLDTGAYEKVQILSKMSLPDVAKIGIIGGGELNGRLAAMGLIDEVVLDVEPVVLGQGKKLFGSRDCNLRLKLLSSKRVGTDTVQNHYEVIY